MDLESRKIAFVQAFLKLQSEEAISRLEKTLLNESKSYHDNETEPLTVNEFNDRVDKSMKDSKNERLTETKALKVKIDKWR